MDIKIVNRFYDIFLIEEPNEYMNKNNLQAYCDYNTFDIVISKKYLGGDNKSKETVRSDLLHECIHAYLNEIGVDDLNNEFTVNIISAMILNNTIIFDVNDLADDVFCEPIMFGKQRSD